MALTERVFVAGHRGLVGSALVRAMERAGYAPPITRTRNELNLLDAAAVGRFFAVERPAAVLLAAARVGGIGANDSARWDFLYENLVIQSNVLQSALATDVGRVVFFGSSCIYPKEAPQPITEDSLLTGPLEPTNEPYAIAKIAGIKLVESAVRQFGKKWVSLMPTNLYGPGDNFDLETAHVLAALIRKFHDARASQLSRDRRAVVTLWGTGAPRREFLHADDLARAALLMLENDATGLFNVGSGSDLRVDELALLVARVSGYDGPIEWDSTRPDGTLAKLIDSSRIRRFGWTPSMPLEQGVRAVYDWYARGAAANTLRSDALQPSPDG
ncbi:MAG: GDP-L-fucose synthase [Gemmatimonadaceae bacterium]